ncbi:MAG: hypothetical protein U1E38_00615 [Rhodospirillales bacterium]
MARGAHRDGGAAEWLLLVPPAERVRVVCAGSRFAIRTGLFHARRRFCEGGPGRCG